MTPILCCHLVINRRARCGSRVGASHACFKKRHEIFMTDSDLMPLRDRGGVLFCAVINSCSSCESKNEEGEEASKPSQGYKLPWSMRLKPRLSNSHFVIEMC